MSLSNLKSFKDLDQLADYLEATYPARCIDHGEAPNTAHRYAGKHELAGRLIGMIRNDDVEADDVGVELD